MTETCKGHMTMPIMCGHQLAYMTYNIIMIWKTCLYTCIVYVRGRCVSDTNIKWSRLLTNCKLVYFDNSKAKWPADREDLMRLTKVADSWCWYDLKQPAALELTFTEKNLGKIFKSVVVVFDRLCSAILKKNLFANSSMVIPQKWQSGVIKSHTPNITTKGLR